MSSGQSLSEICLDRHILMDCQRHARIKCGVFSIKSLESIPTILIPRAFAAEIPSDKFSLI